MISITDRWHISFDSPIVLLDTYHILVAGDGILPFKPPSRETRFMSGNKIRPVRGSLAGWINGSDGSRTAFAIRVYVWQRQVSWVGQGYAKS